MIALRLEKKEEHDNLTEQNYREFYSGLEKNQKIMLGVLYLSANDVITGRCNISKLETDKKMIYIELQFRICNSQDCIFMTIRLILNILMIKFLVVFQIC